MKRTQVLVVLVLFMVIASCTTNQSAFLPPPLPEVEAHILSGAVVPKRNVASVPGESDLESEFQSILSSSDVDKSAHAEVARITKLFYRTQSLLNDYDAKLDEVSKQENPTRGALLVDDTYARLVSAWSVRQEMLARISFFYKRSIELGRQDRAIALRSSIRNAVLSSPNSTNRLAKQELLHELIEIDRQKKDQESLNFILQAELINGAEEMTAFYARNERQLRRETDAAKTDEDSGREIEARLPEVRDQLKSQFESRAPQSHLTIRPGVGRSGMMNGMEFSPGTWALTFDDGPHPTLTLQALANLKSNGMKATFFWVANNVARLHEIVGKVIAAGMTVANHSYTHANLAHASAAVLTHEIIDSTTVDVHAGYRPKFFRCPYGACGSQTSAVRQKIASLDMVSVTWNVDSLDWQDKNPASVYARVKKQMAVEKRGIILFHDIHPQSIAASKMLMADFAAGQKNGKYRTVTIEQAFNELNSPEGMK